MVLERIRVELKKRINDLAEHMASGACPSYEEYLRCAGEVAGLRRIDSLIADAVEEIERLDD